MSVVAYCRVSTLQQSERGLSLQEQEERCRAYATDKGWNITKVVHEVGSGYKPRPLKKLNSLIMELPNDSTVLVSSYDRFSRNVVEGVSLVRSLSKRKIRVISVESPMDTLTPSGQYCFTINVASGEHSSALTGHKIRQTFARQRANGSYVGYVPYGYRAVKTPLQDGSFRREKLTNMFEQDVIHLISALRSGVSAKRATSLMYRVCPDEDRAPVMFYVEKTGEKTNNGSLNFRDISNLLNEYHVPTRRRGKEWTYNSIQRISKRSDNVSEDVVRGMMSVSI